MPSPSDQSVPAVCVWAHECVGGKYLLSSFPGLSYDSSIASSKASSLQSAI